MVTTVSFFILWLIFVLLVITLLAAWITYVAYHVVMNLRDRDAEPVSP